MIQTIYYLAGALLAMCGILGALVKWHYRDVRRIEARTKGEVWDGVRRSFIMDMATNHLPHIYDALKMLAEDRGIELRDPPPIRYMPYEPSERP